MKKRPYNFIWLLLAVLLAGQSLVPMSALAEVTVRCMGAPASSTPCAHDTFAVTGTEAIAKHFSTMPCCRAMANCLKMPIVRVGNGFSMSAPKCLVTVTLLNTKPAALSTPAHRWLLLSAPTLAPPTVRPASLTSLLPADITFCTFSRKLPPSVSTHSHGLRAPPVA